MTPDFAEPDNETVGYIHLGMKVAIPATLVQNLEDLSFLTNQDPKELTNALISVRCLAVREALVQVLELGVCDMLAASPGLRHAFAKLREVQ